MIESLKNVAALYPSGFSEEVDFDEASAAAAGRSDSDGIKRGLKL